MTALPGLRIRDGGARLTDRDRLLIAVLWLVLVAAALLPLPAPPAIRVIAIQFGPAVAVLLWAGVRSAHRFILYAITLGSALLTLAALAMAWSAWWRVDLVAGCWLAITAAALAAMVVRLRNEFAPPRRRQRRLPGAATLLTAATIVVGWVLAVSVAWLRRDAPRPAGMALSAGGWWFAGLLLVLVGTTISLLRLPRLRALSVTAAASVTVVSQAAMYGMPTVMVAARHVGVGEFIDSFAHLVPDQDIYQAWSGLFASTAFLTRSSGLTDPFGYATWWGALSAAVMALAVRAVAGRFVGAAQAWLAALVFALGNSLNTPFYAPQVYGFIASFALVTILLGVSREQSRRRIGLACAGALVISCASAITHQLSPYLISAAVLMLLLTRVLRPWWLGLIPLVPALIWLGINHGVVTRYLSPEAFGQLFANLAPPEHPPPPIGLPMVNRITFGLPALLLVAIGLVALWQLLQRRDRTSLTLALAAGSPVLLLALTDYGAEGIFRVALFALPWLALLAVGGRPEPPVGRYANPAPRPLSAARIGCTAVALLLAVAVNVVGSTGMDWARVIRADDVAVIRHFERTAPTGSALMTPGSQLATPIAATENYLSAAYFSRESLIEYYRPDQRQIYPATTGADYDAAADLAEMSVSFLQASAPAHYLFVSDSSQAYNYRYGLQWPQDYDKLRRAVADSGYWALEFSVGDAKLYRLVSPPPGSGPIGGR